MVGRAVNPAHRDVYFPGVSSDKLRIVEEIAQILFFYLPSGYFDLKLKLNINVSYEGGELGEGK